MQTADAVSVGPLRWVGFRWFFAGRVVSLFGNAMTPVALAFAVLEASGNARDLSFVLAAHTIPLIAFVLVGGSLADRYSRGTVLRVSNFGAALTQGVVAYLLISGHYHLGAIIVLEACNGVLQAFTTPALRGIVPELVPATAIRQANSLLSSSRNLTRIVGPSAAGVLVATAGGGWAIAIDSASFLAASVCMARVRLPAKVPAGTNSMIADLRAGWAGFWNLRWVWPVVAAFSVANAIQVGIFQIVGPSIALATIGAGAWGAVLSARAVGVLVMGAAMYKVAPRRMLAAGQVAVILVAVPILALGLHADTYWLVGTAFVAGLGSGVFGIAWETSLQEHVPNHLLSRVSAYDEFGSYVAIPAGQLAIVPIAAAFGNAPVAFVGGLVYAGLAASPLLSRAVRGLEHTPAEEHPPAGRSSPGSEAGQSQ